MAFGARGPSFSPVSACATGAHAVGEAARMVARGEVELAFAGGTEATITPLGVGGFAAMKALSQRNDSPERASRPFDAQRDGFVCAEGAGVLVLEPLDAARARGARVWAEVVGYGQSSDAHHITAPDPDARGARAAIAGALADARLNPEQVGYVNAHGTSTPFNDAIETLALKAVFGSHAPALWVSSTKSMTGHMLGAAGAVEAAYTAMALAHACAPPTINLEHPDPACDLDYVPGAPASASPRCSTWGRPTPVASTIPNTLRGSRARSSALRPTSGWSSAALASASPSRRTKCPARAPRCVTTTTRPGWRGPTTTRRSCAWAAV